MASDGVGVRARGELGDVERPPRDECRHGASLSESGPAQVGPSSIGQGFGVDDGQRRDGSGEHDVEASQAGALVGLGRGDRGRLDDDRPGRTPGPWRRWPARRRPGGRCRRGPGRARRARSRCRSTPSTRLATRSSGAMTPIDPGSASSPATTSAVRARRSAGGTGDQVEPARVVAHRHRRAEAGRHVGEQLGGVLDDARRARGTPGRAPRRGSPACPGGAARTPTSRSPTASCPGRCRPAPSPSRSSTGARRPAAAWATGPAPRRGRRDPSDGVRAMWSPSSSSRTVSAPRPAGGPLGAGRVVPQQDPSLLVGQQVLRVARQLVGVGQQREQHGLGVERRPQRRDVLLHDRRCGPPGPAPGRRVSRRHPPSGAAPRGRGAAAASGARRRSARPATSARRGSR